MIGNMIPPTDEPVSRLSDVGHGRRCYKIVHTTHNDTHGKGAASTPVVVLYSHGRDIYQTSTNSHTKALREVQLVVLATVSDGEHEQSAGLYVHRILLVSKPKSRNIIIRRGRGILGILYGNNTHEKT